MSATFSRDISAFSVNYAGGSRGRVHRQLWKRKREGHEWTERMSESFQLARVSGVGNGTSDIPVHSPAACAVPSSN